MTILRCAITTDDGAGAADSTDDSDDDGAFFDFACFEDDATARPALLVITLALVFETTWGGLFGDRACCFRSEGRQPNKHAAARVGGYRTSLLE